MVIVLGVTSCNYWHAACTPCCVGEDVCSTDLAESAAVCVRLNTGVNLPGEKFPPPVFINSPIFTRDSVAIARICYGNSVCLSVCLSHGWISQKRLKLG